METGTLPLPLDFVAIMEIVDGAGNTDSGERFLFRLIYAICVESSWDEIEISDNAS